jgi:hypothetical protein
MKTGQSLRKVIGAEMLYLWNISFSTVPKRLRRDNPILWHIALTTRAALFFDCANSLPLRSPDLQFFMTFHPERRYLCALRIS